MEISEGVCSKVSVKIIDSMKDIKYRKKISGLQGADCLLCETKQEDWLKRARAESGFEISRCAQENAQL